MNWTQALAIFLLGLFLSTTALAQSDDITFETIPCPMPEPTNYETLCGALTVPEDYDDPTGAMITITFMRIFSDSEVNNSTEAMLYLSGGPGSALLEFASSFIDFNVLTPVLEHQDIVFYDVRGVGFSDPQMDCEASSAEIFLDQLTRPINPQEIIDETLACQDEAIANGIRPEYYTTQQLVSDTEALRQALGIEQWHLYGVSYGAKLALTIVRDNPDSVASIVLDSVYPLEVAVSETLLPNSLRAIEELFAECAEDYFCNRLNPNLSETFYRLYNDLNANPQMITIEVTNYGTRQVLLDGHRFYNYVFGWMYNPNLFNQLPDTLTAANDGDFSQIVEPRVSQAANYTGSNLVYWSVQCSDEIQYSSPDAVTNVAEQYPDFATLLELDFGMSPSYTLCDQWQTAPPNLADNEPVTTDVPTLILAGTYDPITPPSWGQQVAEALPNSTFVEIGNVGHGVLNNSTCAQDIIEAFISDPTADLDLSCVQFTNTLRF